MSYKNLYNAEKETMKSMTGYGKGMVAGDDFSVSVDLKTVNNRFLDIHLRVGSELASLEPAIKKRITSRLSRGRVDVSISMERASQIAYELNRPLIAAYVNALRQLQQDFGIAGELDINVLARIPGAIQPAKNGVDERMTVALEAALDQALDELEKMREHEGEALKKELRERVQKIESLVPVIEASAAGLADAYRQRLQKRLADRQAGSPTREEVLDLLCGGRRACRSRPRSELARLAPPASA